ncbi:DUF397 domain-containing protein [Nocardia otitidiscaviarum]|uniref:DUF397 domain-containing protein n=1 Tax=Nocardia otitidiscaviarum TaxID=1823 RepID=A0A516NXF6_9NOCA|nr:DUF397 domain-containing protein [Nocardia otitidiscaviarum]MCP9624437.1 DUF397 domain-containing protein [Nocardia otitidiscaviarum]QDP83571.1 DUF397 domain-containing protein [Nocardia otitidiscaviarum]
MFDPAQATWFKSSYSTSGGECVEAAHLPGGSVGVRDSTLGEESPVLLFDGPAWDAFTSAVDAGRFDPR